LSLDRRSCRVELERPVVAREVVAGRFPVLPAGDRLCRADARDALLPAVAHIATPAMTFPLQALPTNLNYIRSANATEPDDGRHI
jgi:hypothetical protein